jgi:Domain of unknown function (DUF6794)
MFEPANAGPFRGFRLKLALSAFSILVAAFLTFQWLDAAEIETTPQNWLLGPDNWPVTVDETVRDILPRISRLEKLRIRFMKKEEDTTALHFGLGLWIRNRYGLRRGNEKLLVSACGFRCQPDDASGKIIDAVWETLRK